MTLFLLFEISKLLKKPVFTSMIPDIINSLALSASNPAKDNKGSLHIFSNTVTLMNQLWSE